MYPISIVDYENFRIEMGVTGMTMSTYFYVTGCMKTIKHGPPRVRIGFILSSAFTGSTMIVA